MSKKDNSENNKETNLENTVENEQAADENTSAEENAENNDTAEAEMSEEDILKAEIEKKDNAIKELNDKLLRNMAEFDNFRKRTTAEKSVMYEKGSLDTLEKLLPVIDNFDRAVNTAKAEDKETNLYTGVEMIYNQFNEILKALGVEEIEGEGAEFDPNLHNAVFHIEDENMGENVIAEVLQKGYKYKDKVLRPSMVKVAN